MTSLSSIWESFAATAEKYPDRPAINVLSETAIAYGIEAGEQTYGEIAIAARKLAVDLENKGYGAGHRIMLLLENRPSYFVWFLAINRIGGSLVPVNPDLRHAELTYMIGHSEPVLIVAIDSRIEELKGASDAAEISVPVIAPEASIPEPGTAGPLALITTTDGTPVNRIDWEAALLYTSGTTGNPKGCVLSNTYFLEVGRWYAEAGGLCSLTHEGERMITPLPIFHMNAMSYSFMAMVTVGGCLTVLDRFHPSTWWNSVRESKATCLHYLGVMPSILMGAKPDESDLKHSVKFGFGAGIDPKLHAPFEERFGFPLVEAWAMTETGAGAVLCSNIPPRRVGEACIGRAELELEIRLVDDTGADSEFGPGELLVRRSGEDPRKGFFSSYFKDEKASTDAWKEGWFHTGDLVRREADGSMFFVDRKKNVIRRSGENIAAVEVESFLMRHPSVNAAGVAAVPDPIRGDEVFACLKVENPNAQLAEEITHWCLEQMAYYKAPGYIAFVDQLPLTATQKIQRAELKKLAAELLSNEETVDTRHLKKRSAA